MRAHNIPYQYKEENHLKLSQIQYLQLRNFYGKGLKTQERVGNSCGKRAISVLATKVLLHSMSDVVFSCAYRQ